MRRIRATVRGRRATPRAEAGMTLAELTVSLVVFGVLMSAILGVTLQVYRIVLREGAIEDSLHTARLAMDQTTRDVRSAATNYMGGNYQAFSEATPTAVTFFSPGGTYGMVRERISLNTTTGVLSRTTTQADAVPADGRSYTFALNNGQRTDQLATGISATTSGTPLLQYVVVTPAASSTATATAVTSGTVTLVSDLVKIGRVIITLTVTPASSTGARPVTLVSTVDPYNLK
jgi:type II secretory pathway pseudopilin PulG